MNSSKNSCSFEKLYQKLRSVFHPISNLLEIGLKNSAAPRFSTYFYVSGYQMKHCVSFLYIASRGVLRSNDAGYEPGRISCSFL